MKPSRGSGDKGETSLYKGGRVVKDHARVEAYGTVDELNSVIGALIAHLPETDSRLIEDVRGVQSDLMHAGSLLSSASVSKTTSDAVGVIEKRTIFLEKETDRLHGDLPGLSGFILPGGHASSAWAHLARTVCRRAERRVVRLLRGADSGDAKQGATGRGEGGAAEGRLGGGRAREGRAAGAEIDEAVQKTAVYLNRLSDYLYVIARHCNRLAGVKDDLWSK